MHTLHIGKLVRRFYFKTKFGGYNNLHFKLSFIKVYFLVVQIPVIFLPARRYASAGYRDRNVSVCLSVRHAPVLCQNEES